MSYAEKIKKNNTIINGMIESIIQYMKQNNISAIEEENGEFKLNEMASQIMKYELNKILLIYDKEFYYLEGREKYNTNITIRKHNDIDAFGHSGGMELASGTAEAIKKLNSELTYSKDKNGRIRFDRNGKKVSEYNGKIDKIKNGNNDFLYLESEKIENELMPIDYITYLALNKSTDIEFFLDAMPHEAMHIFGFSNEGVAETLTRKCCNKYDIRNLPFAHSEHTKFIQKIEQVVGMKELAIGMYGRECPNAELFFEKVSAQMELEDENLLFEINELYSNGEIKDAQNLEKRVNKRIKSYTRQSDKVDSIETIEYKEKNIILFQEREISELEKILEKTKNKFVNSLKENVADISKTEQQNNEDVSVKHKNKENIILE